MRRCYGCMKEYSEKYDVCPYCGYIVDTEPEVKSHLIPGTKLAGRFVVGKAIGHGGFGITYIAWDEKIRKVVAIKEYFPNAFSTRSAGETQVSCFNTKGEAFLREGVAKMLDEAKRLSVFSQNDNIVDISDYFEENNTAYIVMEYLEGRDLKKHLEENGGKLAPETSVEIILPVLNALEDMHKANLIHRDVSPDNIFICDNGKVKLLDFGSARLAVEDSDKSLSVMVKRGYAPKEQYASRAKQGPWTDVYSVCATLYRMITGQTPSESTEREDESLISFSEYGITGYESLEKVIFKGLEVDYKDRTGSIQELRNMLMNAENNEPVPVAEETEKAAEDKPAPEPTPEQPVADDKPKSKLNMKAIIAAVAAVAVIVAGVVAAVKFMPDKKPDTAETTTATVTEETVAQASKELVEKAIKAYEEELALCDDYFSAYVEDINKDGIPEVICRPGEMGSQFALTYTEKNGLSQIDLTGHSSMTPEVYISEDNCIYMRDDGHNQGTAFYHYAVAYKVDETGFAKIGEVEGEDPEDFDWENEAVFNEMDAKYEKLFEEKLLELIGEKEFKAYSEAANKENPVEYINSAFYAYTDNKDIISASTKNDGLVATEEDFSALEELLNEVVNMSIEDAGGYLYTYNSDSPTAYQQALKAILSFPYNMYKYYYQDGQKILEASDKTFENSPENDMDPLGKFGKRSVYGIVSADNVDWIIENVFNATSDRENATVHNYGSCVIYYYDNNYYYAIIDGGGCGYNIKIVQNEQDENGIYTVKYLIYCLEDLIMSGKATCILKDIDGKRQWSFLTLNHVSIPDVFGYKHSVARDALEEAGIEVAKDLVYENSDESEGTVLRVEYELDEDGFPKNNKATLVVSNGIPEVVTATITLRLPDNGSTRGYFEVFVDNESYTKKTLLMNGKEYSFDVQGSDSDVSVKVYIDDKEYYTCTIDFTKNPAVVSNEEYTSDNVDDVVSGLSSVLDEFFNS